MHINNMHRAACFGVLFNLTN